MTTSQFTSVAFIKNLGLVLALTLAAAMAWAQAPTAPVAPVATADAAAAAPVFKPSLLRDGYEALQKKDYAKAETYLARAYQQNPNDDYALLNLAVVYQATGRQNAAVLLYQKVIAANHSAAGVYTDALQASKNTGVTGQTAADMARHNLSLIDPAGDRVIRDSYQALQDKDYAKAEALLNQARVQRPNDAFVLLNLGVLYQSTGRGPQAAQLFEQIISESAKTSMPARVVALARRDLALIEASAR